MDKNDGKWTYSRHNEYFNEGEYFDTKEEAISAGSDFYDDDPFYVGQVDTVGLGVIVDADSILEHININMVDEVGEAAEAYLMHVDREHANELEKEISDVLVRWIEKHQYGPTFFRVANIEKVN